MTEKEKIDNLMKARYKVIADYPGSNMAVGKIIEFEWQKENQLLELCHYYDKYPHIFKRLKWWHEREAEEMPDYIRRIKLQGNSDPEIKIGDIVPARWGYDYFDEKEYPEFKMLCFFTDNVVNFDENCFEPATEEEYKKQTP